MLESRAKAWVHAECSGLEVRAPGLFGLRRSIPRWPFLTDWPFTLILIQGVSCQTISPQ